MPDGDEADAVPELHAGRSAWITRILLLGLAAVITVIVVRLVGQIDWAAVWDALGQLTWWQPAVLLGMLVVRQVLNAMPVALYIPNVSVYRATLNDLAASLMGLVAPPPSDLVLRMGMFASWGVSAARALAGLVLNMLTFYIVRFTTPLLGFVLAAALGWAPGLRWLELLSLALAAAMVVTLHLVVSSQQLAVTVGTRAGRAAHRVRRSVDPDAWGDACQRFRVDVQERYRTGFARGLLSQVGMIAADFTMLLLCLRFVGVDAADVSAAEVAVAYLFAFPFTIFPFMGIGVVDALILAAIVEAGGLEVEAAAVAALIVWRVFTLAGPAVLGVFALTMWRSTTARAAAA
jgi:uncharacterized membrane protein YbhN (UPF0104 family)